MFSPNNSNVPNPSPVSVSNDTVLEVRNEDWLTAGARAWHALHDTKIDGVIWHRPPSSSLWSACAVLSEIAHKLDEKESYCFAPKNGELNEAVAQLLTASGIRRALSKESPEALTILTDELRSMFTFVSALTKDPNCVVSLRVEKRGGTVENFHRDYGIAVINTLVGPGTHFTSVDNIPEKAKGVVWREELLNPEQIVEVPTGATLIMRGRSVPNTEQDDVAALTPGLWHASPGKYWNNAEQWPVRIVLIATSPTDQIVTPALASEALDDLHFPVARGMSA